MFDLETLHLTFGPNFEWLIAIGALGIFCAIADMVNRWRS